MPALDQINQGGTIYEIVPEIAELFKTTKAYHTGDHVIYEAGWYTFKADKSAGAWDATKVDGPFKVTEQISNLKEDLNGKILWSPTALSILDQLGSHIAFTSAEGGQLWDDLIDELESDTPATMYDVTWTGSNYESTNTATSVREGSAYSTTISPSTGYIVSAVTASMGNTAVVPTNNGDGTYTVSIASVEDDIAISVTTQADTSVILYHVENLVCDGTQSAIETPLQFSSASANGVTSAWSICVKATGASSVQEYSYPIVAGNDRPRIALDTYNNTRTRISLFVATMYSDVDPLKDNTLAVVITHEAGVDNALTAHYVSRDTGEVVTFTPTGVNPANYLSVNNALTPLCVGAKSNGTSAFIGTIEDVTIYNRILTSTEISAYLLGGESA